MNSIITLFREQVSKNGAKTAIAEPGGRSVTYSGLDENARRVAAKLLSDGLEPGEPVLITASRGIGFVEAIFGILYAGGAYVPLSDHYPEDRTEFIKKVKAACALYREGLMQDGKVNPVTGIFWQKNYDGFKDQQELVVTPTQTLGDDVPIQEIEEKYRERVNSLEDRGEG